MPYMAKYLSHIVSKPTLTRFAQGPFWQNFFDTLLNLEGGERKCLPNLLDMAGLCREAFKRGDGMQEGLDKANFILIRNSRLSRRRSVEIKLL